MRNIYWVQIIHTLNIIVELRVASHYICVPCLLLKNRLWLEMQVHSINYIFLILNIIKLFDLCVLIELHIVVNIALLDNAVEYFIFDVFVLNVWNQHILTQSETHIRQVHYHHCYFFFTDLLIVSDIENFKYIFVLFWTRLPAQLIKGLNEIFECNIVWLGTINIPHEFVKSDRKSVV